MRCGNGHGSSPSHLLFFFSTLNIAAVRLFGLTYRDHVADRQEELITHDDQGEFLMPILLPVDELTPGMALAESFLHEGRVMITAGRTLHQADIRSLSQKYPYAMVKVGDPILEQAADFEDDGYERSIAEQAQSTIAGVMSDTARQFSRRASLSGKDFAALQDAANVMMKYLKDNPVTAALLTRSMGGGGYLADHTGAVFYLSMVLGSTIKTYIAEERMKRTSARDLSAQTAMDLKPLGLGAMFMDMGMFALSDLYNMPQEKLSEQQHQSILEHPITGADMLPGTISAATRMIVRTHHENVDGSGYPAKHAADKLHIFSKIIRICDSYAAATTETKYRRAKSSAKVLWEMKDGPWRRCYDPLLVDMFTRLIQPFPIGAKLRLNDGTYGVLVKYNRHEVFKPTVLVAFDQFGQRLPNEQLKKPFSLADQTQLRIESFGGENLSYLYGPPALDETHVANRFVDVYEAMIP